MSVTREDVKQFTGEFATRLGTGRQSLVGMLVDLTALQPNPDLRLAVADVTQQVMEGHMLSRALAQHPAIFGAEYVAVVRSGERGGNLDETLRSLL